MLNYCANGPAGYNLTRSLRFRSSASASLSRTFGTPTSGTTWTMSFWFKRGALGVGQELFAKGNTSTQPWTFFYIDANGALNYYEYNTSNGNNVNINTTPLYRDPSAWYHIMVVVDSTQATASNRIKFYVNGSQVTALGTASTIGQNTSTVWNSSGGTSYFGRQGGGDYLDGYLTEINFIDGQALTPSFFGSTNSLTGVWQPKQYTGTYGTNGFYLNFSNIALTSGSNTGLGKDYSGNGNYWNTNNISVTSGTTYDAMTDVPTLTSATVANYATLNPVDNPSSSNSLANANLTPSTAGASGWKGIRATMAFPTTGKWYYEVTLTSGTNNLFLGIVSSSATGVYHDNADTFAIRMSDCALRPSGATATGTQAGYAVGDVFGVAIDCSTPTVQFYKNGSLNVTYTSPTFDPSKIYFPCFMGNDTGASATHNYNFGQRPFTYTPPSGYVALNTYNLPTSTIVQGNKYMGVLTYTGNGSTSVTRSDTSLVNFTPDLVWIKQRSSPTANHNLFDINRISGSDYLRLYSNDTAAEESSTYAGLTNLNGFVNGGFTTGAGGNTNTNGNAYVAWCWDANGAPSSNTSGSITSNVSVNTSAGFSVVTYTGNGTSNATVGHGLGVTPKMIIYKNRSAIGNWIVYHTSLGNNGSNYAFLEMNTTAATQTVSSYLPVGGLSSTTFMTGTTGSINASGNTYVAYCWAEISGFSKFGSYTGNGSTDGTFVYTGFRPKYVLIKRTDTGGFAWEVYDNARNLYNSDNNVLYPNLSDAEASYSSGQGIDSLSNGFKLRASGGGTNANGGTYIYAAFAENPFKNSLAR